MNVDVNHTQLVLIVALAVWEIIWKGFALWRAAYRNQPYWFAVLLFINTVGILPIVYLLATSDKRRTYRSELAAH